MASGARIGSLSVLLSLNSAKFSGGIMRARKALAGFAGGATGSIAIATAKLAKFGGALTAAAVGGFAVMLRQTTKSLDETAKWSSRIGIASEKLMGLEHAAALTGVTTRQLRTGLQRMTRRISEASVGTGEALKTFRELGVNIQELNNMAPDRQFLRIADALGNVEKRGDRVRHTVKIFDMEAAGLVNTLMKGRTWLTDSILEAQKLGLAVNRIDISRIENFSDQLLRMKALFRGIARQVTIAVVPIINKFATQIYELVTSGRGLEGVMVNAFTGIGRSVVWLGGLMDSLIYTFRVFNLMLLEMSKNLHIAARGILTFVRWTPGALLFRAVGQDPTRWPMRELDKNIAWLNLAQAGIQTQIEQSAFTGGFGGRARAGAAQAMVNAFLPRPMMVPSYTKAGQVDPHATQEMIRLLNVIAASIEKMGALP